MKIIGCALAALTLLACHDEPPLRPLSVRAAGVRVEKSEPPAGASLLGEIEGSDGSGCAIDGERGSLANAEGALKEAALRRGANFVKLTQVTTPYSGHDCYHQEFKLRGLAYAVRSRETPIAVSSTSCAPACSPGYACNSSGVCVAECNPACAPQQICRADRVCVQAAAP